MYQHRISAVLCLFFLPFFHSFSEFCRFDLFTKPNLKFIYSHRRRRRRRRRDNNVLIKNDGILSSSLNETKQNKFRLVYYKMNTTYRISIIP